MMRVDAKVAFCRRIAADRDRLVGHPDVAGRAIALGVDRHRREAHVTARADHAHRDLPAVGDEDFAQNQANSSIRGCETRHRTWPISEDNERPLNSIKCTGFGSAELLDRGHLIVVATCR